MEDIKSHKTTSSMGISFRLNFLTCIARDINRMLGLGS